MPGNTVLIVEDDAELRSVPGRGLREEGFTVETAATGETSSPAPPVARPTST